MNRVKTVLITTAAAVLLLIGSTGCDNPNTQGGNGENGEFTYKDVITAYDAFNKHLFDQSRGVYHRDTNATGAAAVGWTQAMMFDMIINAYKLTGDQKYLDLMSKHYQGCNVPFKFDWYNYNYWDLYDDMMWWVASFARAYLLTEDEKYLTLSKDGFHRVWYGKPEAEGGHTLDALGSFAGDDPKDLNKYNDGGMYWDWKFGRTGKMACINYPTVIAAMELYKATGNGDYLNKAKDVYDWSAKNLFNSTSGAVGDSKHDGNSGPDWTTLIYNQATCIGSASMLYLETKEQFYLDHAKAAMDYIVREKSNSSNTLRAEGDINQTNVTDEMGIYNAILAQYLPILIVDCGQTQYLEYIERSINLGWNNRDTKRNLTNKSFEKVPLSTEPLSSYTASGIPALMLTFPNVKERR